MRTVSTGFPFLHGIRKTENRKRKNGFTLLELIIVIGLMLVLVGISVISVAYLENDDPMLGPCEKLITMAKIANRSAVVQGRPIVIAFDKTNFTLVGAHDPKVGNCELPKDMKVNFQRWNWGKKYVNATGLNWEFYPTGICDALRFQFVSSEGTVEVGFNPLTGSVTEQQSYLKKK